MSLACDSYIIKVSCGIEASFEFEKKKMAAVRRDHVTYQSVVGLANGNVVCEQGPL